MFSRKKFRIKKAGKHTRKLTGGEGGIAWALSTAFKNAKEKWDDGVKLTKQENPRGAELDAALIARGVNVPKAWTNPIKKEELKADGTGDFKIDKGKRKVGQYHHMNYWYDDDWAQAHIHVYGDHGAGFHPKSLNTHDIKLNQTDKQQADALDTWIEALNHAAAGSPVSREKKANWKTFFTALRPLLRKDAPEADAALPGSSADHASAATDQKQQEAEELLDLLDKIVDQATAGYDIAKSMRYGINCGYRICKSAIYFCKSSLQHIQYNWRRLTQEQLTSIKQQLTLIQDKVQQMSEEVLTQSMSMVGVRHTTATSMRNSASFKNDLKNLLTYIYMIKWCSVGAKKYAFPLKWESVPTDPSEFIDKIWDMNIKTAELEDRINRGLVPDELLQAGPQETLGVQFVTGLRGSPTIAASINREAQAAAALSAVIPGNDEDALSAAIEEAEEAGVNAELMSNARERLTQLKQEREARERAAWEASPVGRAHRAKERAQQEANRSREQHRLRNGQWITKQKLQSQLRDHFAYIQGDQARRRRTQEEVDKIWGGLTEVVQPAPQGGKRTRKRKKNQRRKTKRHRR